MHVEIINTNKFPMEKMEKKEIMAIIALIGLFILALFVIDDGSEQNYYEDPYYHGLPEITADNVVVGRAYLDGVQDGVVNGVSIVGLRYINGEPVTEDITQDCLYEAAVNIVNNEWRPLIKRLVKQPMEGHVEDVLVLTAMRMGPTRFANSTLLKKVNEGKFDEATKYFRLEKDGEPMEMGLEARQYFRMLQALWTGEVTFKKLLWLPMFSYRQLNDSEISYDIFMETAWNKLETGDEMVPADALGLW